MRRRRFSASPRAQDSSWLWKSLVKPGAVCLKLLEALERRGLDALHLGVDSGDLAEVPRRA